MQIFMKYTATRVYNVEPQNTVEDLQEMIWNNEALRSKDYYLVHSGKILEKGRRLSDHNITNNDTIYLNIRFGSKNNK